MNNSISSTLIPAEVGLTAKTQECVHCGTPFSAKAEDDEFCCAGCEVVHQILFNEGLDRFYDLKGENKVRPAKERPFQPAETDWVEGLIESSETDEEFASATVQISGATCVGCVWLIETLFLRLDGAKSASVDPSAAEGTFSWEKGSGALLELAKEIPRYGYALDSPSSDRGNLLESKKLLARLGISAAFALNTMAFSLPRYLGMDDSFQFARIFDLVALSSSTLTLLIGGSYFFQKAIGAIRQKTVHIDLPIALGLALAFFGSCVGWLAGKSELFFFDFVAIFTSLMLGGRYLHLVAVERVSHRLQGQSAIVSDVVLTDGARKVTDELESGDEFEIPPGRAIPVSSRLESPDAEFSMAWMSGEPVPQLFPKGIMVPAGAILLANEPVRLLAKENYGESTVSKLYQSAGKSIAQHSENLFLKGYLISIIVIGLLAGLAWLVLSQSILDALQVMISIFVISCPCAIGVAIPLLERRISSAMAKRGVFIQQPRFWQKISKVKHLILDKTGTLTLEHPELKNSEALSVLSSAEKEALGILTFESIHPLDRTLQQQLVSRCGFHSKTRLPCDTTPGVGNAIQFQNQTWTLGKVGWRGRENYISDETASLSCELACDGDSIAVFEFEESLRSEAVSAVERLKRKFRLQIHILSGDQQKRILEFSEKLGISSQQAHGGLSPGQKADLSKSLQPGLYLGDGMNDASAFAVSTTTGTPVTDRSVLDRTADFIFTCQGLNFLPELFQASRWARLTTILVIAFAIVYNAIAITVCCLGLMTPLLAAILMPVSSIICIGIALRPMTISGS